jgi:hypothetical protein
MLVFCEDCGTKHTIAEEDVMDHSFQFRCDVCDFLITAKSLPRPKKKPKPQAKPTSCLPPIDPTMELTCSHDMLDFGLVGDQQKTQTLILAARDGRKVELTGALDTKLEGNVNLLPVSAVAFRVEVVSAAQVNGSCLDQYQGPGVVITDTISRFQKVVSLSFSRA